MLQKTLQNYRRSFTGLSRDIWILSLVMLVNRSGLMVVPFLTIYLTTELPFTKADAALIMTCYGLGAMCGSWIGGDLTDRFHFYYIQVVSLLLSGIGFIGMLWIRDYWIFAGYLFVIIAISDTFRPANLAAISAFSTKETRTRSLSLVRLAINLGIAAGPAVGGLLAKYAGYEWLFIVNGGMCLLSLVVLVTFLPRRELKVPVVEESVVPLRKTSAWSDRTYLIFAFGMLCICIAFVEFIHSFGVYLEEEGGYHEGQIGLLYTLNGLLIVIFEMPIIYYLERHLSMLGAVVIGGAMIVFSYLIFLFFGTATAAILGCLLLLTFGEIVNFPFSNAYAADRSNETNRGSYMGLYTLIFATSHVLAPPLALRTAQFYGWNAAWASVIVVGCLGLLILGGLWRQNYRTAGLSTKEL